MAASGEGAFSMSSRTATALGTGAILLWATLASLTVLRGRLPPFQTTAIAFAIGGVRDRAGGRWRAAGPALMRPTPASLALGIYGLFGYHALYFAALKLAPPAEAHLLSSLWALFTVLFSGLLPGHRLRINHVLGALLGLAAAALLVWSTSSARTSGATSSRLGFAFALGCALVWSSYSVASRLLADVPSESLAVSCLATAVLAFVCSVLFETMDGAGRARRPGSPCGPRPGPVGAAFLLWDIGMKQGDTSAARRAVLRLALISTGLLVVLGLAEPPGAGVACLMMVAAAVMAAASAI